MNILEISVTLSNEIYTKHQGDFGCVRKYDQASSEDFLLNIDFEIDCKKTESENKSDFKKAVLSYINNTNDLHIAESNDFNNTAMSF